MIIGITFHGLGGEGAKTSSSLLGKAAFEEGNWSQASPQFGAERRNAPVKSFCRISDEKVLERGQIDSPDIVVVLNITLFKKVDVLSGLTDNGLLIVNSKEEFPIDTKVKVVFVDATGIAEKHIGKPIPSTAILGVLAKYIDPNMIDIEHLRMVVGEQFGESNVRALQECYEVA
jgi:pyruvate ferredoxin oxidoreductase gamma subunit